MLYRANKIDSTRMILKLAAVVLFLVGGLKTMSAATPVAPELVPYTVTALAGNTQGGAAPLGGFGGDGGPGLSATMNTPNVVAVDSVGNLYIADSTNAVIRELNVQTGILKIIAGQAPSSCAGTVCSKVNSGCSDGIAAVGNPIGVAIKGLAVDSYGNVYYSDSSLQAVYVIYRGGAQVANFIALVDSGVAATASAVQQGFIYHVAGSIVQSTCKGATTPVTDKVLATKGTFHNPGQLSLDVAGNIYISDTANGGVRVINAQSTSQTFFQQTVAAGNIALIVGCNATIGTACPTTQAFNIPANTALYNSQLTGLYVDSFNNVYEIDGTGSGGTYYGGVAYSGGTTLGGLINLESGYTATSGNWYEIINSLTAASPTGVPNNVLANGDGTLALRTSGIQVDLYGNIYLLDNHWQDIYRIDAHSQVATRILGLITNTGTTAAPADCGSTQTVPIVTGIMTSDFYGDGCPAMYGRLTHGTVTATGYFQFDSVGNIYDADAPNEIVHKISVNTQFPATTLGVPVTQTVQIHFDQNNLPPAPITASTFSIVTSSSATVASTASPEFAISTTPTPILATTPVCANLTAAVDGSMDCTINITFTPAGVGPRQAVLLATAASGTVYPFALSGIGSGGQIVVDGGAQSVYGAKVGAKVAAVAVGPTGSVYIADPANNQVVVVPAGGGAQATVGSGLSGPMGVAVDAKGNVFISDTQNSRIVEVAAGSGTQTQLGTGLLLPQGIAVDGFDNVYIADTGNHRIVEIPGAPILGQAPLLAYPGAPTFGNPVSVAVDAKGNIYVADTTLPQIVEIPPGGGDQQTLLGATLPSFGSNLTTPNGVAVDGAGNLYVSDSTSNIVVEIPAATGPGAEQFQLGFSGLSAPGGLALDSNGNVYLADSGNGRVLFENRLTPTINFGSLALFQPARLANLTVSNIGNQTLTLASPLTTATGATTSFLLPAPAASPCAAGGTLVAGLHCNLTPSFFPQVNGAVTEQLALQNGVSLTLNGTGLTPVAVVMLSLSSPTPVPVFGTPAVFSVSVAQPNASNTPTGTVTFTVTVSGAAAAPVTQTLTTSGSLGVTTFTLDGLLEGRSYVVTATYNGDSLDTPNTATYNFSIPGLPLTAASSSLTYTYGAAPPALTGTVTGILPADAAAIKVSFVSGASATSAVGVYPVTLVLSGGNYLNYTIPSVLTPSGTPATVTENPAPLTVVVAPTTAVYGTANLTFKATVTGAVNGDVFTESFTPAVSSILAVGTYSVAPTVAGKNVGDYSLKITSGSLVITKQTSSVTVSPTAATVLPTALTTDPVAIKVVPGPGAFYGTPTGTLSVTDVFTPITATGTGTVVTNPAIPLTLVGGVASYTPTSTTLGTHAYNVSYSGDANYGASTTAAATNVVVDTPDYTVASTTSPVNILPGVIPGGLASVVGEQAAYPEQATLSMAPILGYTGVINITCVSPSSYVTCTPNPASVTMDGKTTFTSVVSISTPATLPINFTSQLRSSGPQAFLAFLPLGALAFLPLCYRSRRKLGKVLWAFLAVTALTIGMSGCGGNSVKFFTPVPAGPQNVTITATSANGALSRSFIVALEIQ